VYIGLLLLSLFLLFYNIVHEVQTKVHKIRIITQDLISAKFSFTLRIDYRVMNDKMRTHYRGTFLLT